MSDPAKPPTDPKPRRWLGLALFLSLALNLVGFGILAGAFMGGVMDGPGAAPGGRMPETGAPPAWIAALDAEDRAALRRAWRREGPGLQALRAQRRADAAALLAALRAEPFEAAALEAALARQAEGLAERQALAQRLLAERLAGMDRAGRAAFADRLEAALARRPERERRDDPTRGGPGPHRD